MSIQRSFGALKEPKSLFGAKSSASISVASVLRVCSFEQGLHTNSSSHSDFTAALYSSEEIPVQ
ncbi:hypothetical protein DPMN_158465 [Dreissena polymorpha]|uniref:Uncharacterized protein n=1 Tax=Dreissena polymorpha TaxID=45954 RepID=A0A9D4EJ50_DREPO|nr:hypothetical protein DPMN_158465 [Dreissena polymorpha]